MIRVQNLSKTYQVRKKEEGFAASIKGLFNPEFKQVNAVKGIDIKIKQGEMVGFIGSNGAGKTTTLKMLSGILHPSSGESKVLGYIPAERKPDFLKQISLVMGQKSQLWWDLPAIDSFSLLKEIYEVPESEYQEILEELTELLDMKALLNQQVRQLSLGQRMKAEIMAALIHRPKIIFLDEPTIGLDVLVQKKLRQFISEYNQKYNATVLLTSHYMDDVQEICERVVIIDAGEIIFDGTVNNLITKFANHKLILPVFHDDVQIEQLTKYGQVFTTEKGQLGLKVQRSQTSDAAARLLNDFDVDDLDIAEPRLEDVVRSIFANS